MSTQLTAIVLGCLVAGVFLGALATWCILRSHLITCIMNSPLAHLCSCILGPRQQKGQSQSSSELTEEFGERVVVMVATPLDPIVHQVIDGASVVFDVRCLRCTEVELGSHETSVILGLDHLHELVWKGDDADRVLSIWDILLEKYKELEKKHDRLEA